MLEGDILATRKIFLEPEMVYNLDNLTTVNVITIENLPWADKNLATIPNSISVFRFGKPIEQIPYENIDNSDNVDKFSINTNNQLVFFVDNTLVQNIYKARMYVWGLVVCYLLKPLKYADAIPTYIMQSFTSQGLQVSETIATDLPTIMNKIKCLDKALDIDGNGFYTHILTRTML